jgi:proteasome lid subunit RPN8/RPN11
MLRIPEEVIVEIQAHMEAAYPDECCGLIYGTVESDARVAEGSRRCRNLNTERSADRYQLDPKDMLALQTELSGGPLDIIGIYHSHPDHPSRPSQFDADHAWEGWSYMIGSVQKGKVASIQSWELELRESGGEETGRHFNEESIEVEA